MGIRGKERCYVGKVDVIVWKCREIRLKDRISFIYGLFTIEKQEFTIVALLFPALLPIKVHISLVQTSFFTKLAKKPSQVLLL